MAPRLAKFALVALVAALGCDVEGVIGKDPHGTDGTDSGGSTGDGSTGSTGHGSTSHGSTSHGSGSTGAVCEATLEPGPCGDCLAAHCCDLLVACETQPGCACVQMCVDGGDTLEHCEAMCPPHNGHYTDVDHCRTTECAAACN